MNVKDSTSYELGLVDDQGVPTGDLCGVGVRRPHFPVFASQCDGVEVVEVLAENFMGFGGRPAATLDAILEILPVVVHGLNLSIAGPTPLNETYMKGLRQFIEMIDPPWFSDHLTFSEGRKRAYHDLVPFPFNKAALLRVADRVKQVQDFFGRPFLLENSSYYINYPGSTMSEADFLAELVQQTDCGLLLDVNNIFVNATNHDYDPIAYLDRLPLGAVRQYHMAGHDASGPFLVDTHGAAAPPPVMALYEEALRRSGPVWTIFEWDNNIPDFGTLLAENNKVKRALAAARKKEPLGVRFPASVSVPPLPGEQETLDLESCYETMDELFDEQIGLDEAVATLGVSKERLAIYPRFVQGHVEKVLAKNYQALAKNVGGERFKEMAHAFYLEQPSFEAEMNEAARAFPQFVAANKERFGLTGAHVALAELEWAEFEVFKCPARCDAEGPGALNATLKVLQLTYPVASWLEQVRQGAALSLPAAPTAETVLLFRHPGNMNAYFYVASERLLFALKVAHDRLSVEEAAKQGGIEKTAVAEILAEASATGLIIQGD